MVTTPVATPAPVPVTSAESGEAELAAHKQKLACPQCQKEIEEGWMMCPYCGCNLQEEERKRQEEDNLKYAPKTEPVVSINEVVTSAEKKPVSPSTEVPVTVSREISQEKSSTPAVQISPRVIGLLAGGTYSRSGYSRLLPMVCALRQGPRCPAHVCSGGQSVLPLLQGGRGGI